MACDDLKMRDSKTRAELRIDAYKCATMSSKDNAFGGCIKASDYCAVCPDGTFKLIESGVVIKSDLYECATKPRRSIYMKDRG